MSLCNPAALLKQTLSLGALALLCAAPTARADAVTEWNLRACEFIAASGLITQPASRVMAISHTAAFEAANLITRRYPSLLTPRAGAGPEAAPGASVEAAIAAAHRTALLRLLPAQQAAIDGAYRAALSAIVESPARDAGVAVGERSALDVLARRADDGASAAEAYRPSTSAGRYVPTALPAVPQWPLRRPWLMNGPAQFRPGPPPALGSERWARDFNEVRTLGGARSVQRSAEQSDIARFWETTLPPIYHGVLRSVADQPGRDLLRNARLFAALTQAIDDAMIAVFDAKYHHGFWRPITAIRNGDIDGNDATERDASWTPFLSTPMHPEYPCAHCIQAGVVGGLLQHDIGTGPVPVLSTTSVTAGGAVRRWSSVEAFVREVADARVYGGMHYRYSTEVGIGMGRQIAALAVQRYLGE